MAWLTVDKNNTERIFENKPCRATQYWEVDEEEDNIVTNMIRLPKSSNDYWQQQVDDYDIRGIKNKAYIASRSIIRSLNKYIKTVKKNEQLNDYYNKLLRK